MSEIRIPLVLVVNEAPARDGYRDYASDHAYYKEHPDELSDGHTPGDGYLQDEPDPWEKYRDEWVGGIVGEILDNTHLGFYRIERAEATE